MEDDKGSSSHSSASKDDHAKSDIKDILKSKLTQQQRDELKQKLKIQQPPQLQNPRSAPGSNAVVRTVPPKIPKREPILLLNKSAKSNKQPYSKAMVFGILFSSAVSVYWIYKILIKRLTASCQSFLKVYTQYLKVRQEKITEFMANIIDLGKIYQYEALPKTINDKLIKHDTIEFEKLMTPLNSHFEAKKHFLSPPPAPESCPYTKLTKSMDELSSLVSRETYFSSSSVAQYRNGYSYGDANETKESVTATKKWVDSIDGVKNECRSVKGMLLSTRNFPTGGR